MNLLQMRYFLAVAESGLLISSANKLQISPAALSKTISRLEKELDAQLFVRTSSGMVLTDAGLLAKDAISTALNALDNMQSAISDLSAEGNARVSIASTASVSCTDMVSAFTNRHPNTFVFFKEIYFPDLKAWDMLNQYDFLISTETQIRGEELCSIPLFAHVPRVMLPVDHPLAAKESVSLAELSSEPLIHSPANMPWTRYVEALFTDRGLSFKPIMECAFSVRTRAVAAGLGVTIVTDMSTRLTPPPANVVILPLSDELPVRNMYLSWHSDRRQTAATSAFQRFAKTYYQNPDG